MVSSVKFNIQCIETINSDMFLRHFNILYNNVYILYKSVVEYIDTL